MKIGQFEMIVEERISQIRKTLAFKGEEYATSKDRLHNFKRAGRLRECTPEDALLGFFMKHLISVLDIVDKIEVDVPSSEVVNEKVGDCINYLILLEALIEERRGDVRMTGILTDFSHHCSIKEENKNA